MVHKIQTFKNVNDLIEFSKPGIFIFFSRYGCLHFIISSYENFYLSLIIDSNNKIILKEIDDQWLSVIKNQHPSQVYFATV